MSAPSKLRPYHAPVWSEPLIMEMGAKGRRGFLLPPIDEKVRRETGDASLEDTAVRETREETGVDLAAHGRILGRLDELQPSTPVLPAIAIAPYVALYDGDARLTLSAEVHDAFWVPMAELADAANWSDVELEIRGARRTFPAFRHGEHVVWGLTERILRQFRARLAAT